MSDRIGMTTGKVIRKQVNVPYSIKRDSSLESKQSNRTCQETKT